MRRFQQNLVPVTFSYFFLCFSFSGCVTTEKANDPVAPSLTALEPTLDPGDIVDEVATASHSTVGPYEIVTPESVELLDSGSIKVSFEAACTQLGSDRVLVWSDPSDERVAHVGVLFAKSECRAGALKRFERVISPGMTEFGTSLPDQAKVRPMQAKEFQLVPAISVVIDSTKGVTMTYSAPCEQIAGSQVISSLEPRSKTLSVAIIFPLSGCKSGSAKTFSSRFDPESEEYLILGGGEKDLVPRPMWTR